MAFSWARLAFAFDIASFTLKRTGRVFEFHGIFNAHPAAACADDADADDDAVAVIPASPQAAALRAAEALLCRPSPDAA